MAMTRRHPDRYRPRPLLLGALAGLALCLTTPCAAACAQQALAPPRGLNLLPDPGAPGSGGPNDLGQYFQGGGSGWTLWWTFNRDPFLAELREPGSGNVIAMPLNGARTTTGPKGLDVNRVHREVVPLLQERLAKTRDIDLAVGCLIAMGKIGEAPRELAKEHELTPVESSIRARLKDGSRPVRNTALLALGLVGGPRATALLASIVEGSTEGKKALGVARIERVGKAYAIYALGLVGHRTRRHSERTLVVSRLLQALESEPEESEYGVAAVLSLGWAPLPLEVAPVPSDAEPRGQENTIRRLLALFEGRKTNVFIRAHIPVAIARLIQSDSGLEDSANALPHAALRERLRLEFVGRFEQGLAQRGGDKSPLAREGLIQALGLLVEPRPDGPDRNAIERLVEIGETSVSWGGALTRVALARVAIRAGTDTTSSRGEIAAAIVERLRNDCTRGRNIHRPWATLALGLFEDAIQSAGGAPSLETRDVLEKQLRKGVSPASTAAASIALGLARDQEVKDELIKGLESGEFMVRGLMSTSLAFMGARDAQIHLRNVIAEKLVNPTFLRSAATALALFHDEGLVELLVGKLARSRFMSERVAALGGLAWSNDPGAIPALLYVVREKRIGSRVIDDKSRAFAAAALGTLCSGSSLPWNSHLALDLTWTATPPSLTDEREGGGVLDLF